MDTRRAIVDGLLVLAARGGDVEAFERLAARWHPRLLRHARRLTGDAGGASDATQDAWVAIVAGLRRLRDPSTFGPWALRITTRRCADWIARRRSARTRDTAIDPSRPAPGPAGSMDDVMRLREALRQLGREERLLLTMLYIEGFAVTEIAQACGIPPGTVKSKLFHARARLRAVLEVPHDRQDEHR